VYTLKETDLILNSTVDYWAWSAKISPSEKIVIFREFQPIIARVSCGWVHVLLKTQNYSWKIRTRDTLLLYIYS